MSPVRSRPTPQKIHSHSGWIFPLKASGDLLVLLELWRAQTTKINYEKWYIAFTMLHYVYILFSKATQRYYVGESAFPENRLEDHNKAKYASASTRFTNDWVIRKLIRCTSRTDALKIEQYIKSMKSRRFIEQLINEASFFITFKIIVHQRFNIEVE